MFCAMSREQLNRSTITIKNSGAACFNSSASKPQPSAALFDFSLATASCTSPSVHLVSVKSFGRLICTVLPQNISDKEVANWFADGCSTIVRPNDFRVKPRKKRQWCGEEIYRIILNDFHVPIICIYTITTCARISLGTFSEREMPLSAEQNIIFKYPNTTIKYQEDNPKTTGSKARQRFEKYKASQTIGETTAAGANWQDPADDFEKRLFKSTPTIEKFRGTDSKRGAEENTPDPEASARAKVAKNVTHCTLESVAVAPASNAKVETGKTEMSAATT